MSFIKSTFIFLLFASITTQAQSQTCDCTDYILVADQILDVVHKFEVDPATGMLTEIGNPWNSSVQNPHGLGQDVNGNYYISELYTGTDQTYKVNCEGDVIPTPPTFMQGVGFFNAASQDNNIYVAPRPTSDGVTSYDLCTGEKTGAICLNGPGAWDIKIHDNGTLYMTGCFGCGEDVVYIVPDWSQQDFIDSTCYDPVLTNLDMVANSSVITDPTLWLSGIDADDNGDFYIVITDPTTQTSCVQKYDVNYNFIYEMCDIANDATGYHNAGGLTICDDYIYVASYDDDCVAILDKATGTYVAGIAGGGGKAIVKATECCPGPITTIDSLICGAAVGTEYFLNDIYACDGPICGGEWVPDAGNTGMTYDPCVQSITVTSEAACGTFTKTGDNTQCGMFTITLNLEFAPEPDVDVSTYQLVCEGDTPATITSTTTTTGLSYQWQISTTSCTEGFMDLLGETNANYSPPILTTDTYYRLLSTASSSCGGTCIDTSSCIPIYLDECTTADPNCSCTDYLYVNDPTQDITHKFTINPDGSIGAEIGSPWLAQNVVTNAHGVVSDPEGNLYISQIDTDPTTLYKINCEGDLISTDYIPDWERTLNMTTIDGTLYSIGRDPNGGPYYIYSYDLCTAAAIDSIMLPDGGVPGWGLTTGLDGELYFTQTFGSNTTYDHQLYHVSSDLMTTTLITSIPNVPGYTTYGVTQDEFGNFYVVTTDISIRATIIYKIDPSGNVIQTISDTTLDQVGFGGAWGIKYDELTGKLYVGTLGEDCVAVIDAGGPIGPMTYEVGAGVGYVAGTYSKAVNIVRECCPNPANITIDSIYCAGIGDEIDLRDFFACNDGIVCSASWTADAGNTNMMLDNCSQTVLILGPGACGSFSLANSNSTQCGSYDVTVNLEAIDPFDVEVSPYQIVCNGDTPAPLTSTTTATGVSYQWQQSTTSCVSGFTDIPGATSASYSPPVLTADTYYRLISSMNGTCASGACNITSPCIPIYLSPCTQDPPVVDGECACKEFIYLNEENSGGVVHKFQVNADGSLYEIGSPWFTNPTGDQFTEPHGLGIDANGNLYIGETANGDIRRLTCDGEAVPASEFEINAGAYNIGTYGNVIYLNNTDGTSTTDGNGIYAYDLCTGAAIGYFCLNGLTSVDWRDWGLYIDPNGMAYVTGNFWDQNSTNDPNNLWVFDVTTAPMNAIGAATPVCIDPLITSDDGIVNIGDSELPTIDIWGVTSDMDGNIYIIEAEIYHADPTQNQARLLKYSPSGVLLATSPYDGVSGMTYPGFTEPNHGFRRAIGIVYSMTSDQLYVSSSDSTEDCIATFDTDLNYLGAAVPYTGTGAYAKGISIIKECCPVNSALAIDSSYCEPAIGEVIELRSLLGCSGGICEGEWTPDSGNTGLTYDACENTITIDTETACGTFTLSSDGTGANAQCGAFTITLDVCMTEPECFGITITRN